MKDDSVRHDFRLASRKAVANARLQAAVRKTSGLLASMRAATVATRPDFEDLRAWGRTRKMEVSGRLEEWAGIFTERIEALGGKVYRARDGVEAGRIMLEIARERGVSAAVKSKSMTAEEVRLNEALEAGGVEVTETDLGEFIIQLAGEHPSHILAPAIHRSREEVGTLFAEKLGAPQGLDVEGMVRFARQVLRRRFLDAGMGITGANFAVADTGTLALVTNEGNGRLSTSLPPVHVALVGMEKIIPSVDDLADFLSLLTCSATGQRISSYVSLTTGPRQRGDGEGPQELHVILLDNGRTRIAEGPCREILHCLHCGSCLNHCPVYRAVGGHAYESPYCGPMGSILAPLLWGSDAYPGLPYACTLCGRCAEVCAVKIPLPAYHRELRRRTAVSTAVTRATARAAAGPRRYRLGVSAMRALLRSPSAPGLLKMNKAARGWLSCRELPKPADGESFRSWWKDRSAQTAVQTAACEVFDAKAAVDQPGDVTASAPTPVPGSMEHYLLRSGAVGVEVHRFSAEELPERLADLVRAESVQSVALPVSGWPGAMQGEIQAVLGSLDCLVVSPGVEGEEADWDREALAGTRLGITFCEAFLAETGSLVVPSGPGRGTLASLLPDVHLAISFPQGLRPSLKAYLAETRSALPARLTLVTGPSRTGDIEGSMTVGVHGPRRVIHWILSETPG